MWYAQYGGPCLEASGDLDGEVLVWLVEFDAVIEELPLVRSSIQNAPEPVDCALAGAIVAVMEGDTDTNLSRAGESVRSNDCYGDVRASLESLPRRRDCNIDALRECSGSKREDVEELHYEV